MRITVTPDKEYAAEIKRKLKDNGGYCPCSLVKNEDTKCMYLVEMWWLWGEIFKVTRVGLIERGMFK